MDKRVKVVFDRKREASNKAEGTVEVQVTLNSKRSYLSTGVRVNRRQWDNGIVTMHPKKIEYNAMVAKKVAEVEKIILGMEMEEVRMTIENFRERLPRNKKKEQRDFLDWMHERLEKRVLREGTRKGHKTTYKALERFGKINTFEDLKLENIYAFDLFLREEKDPETKQRIVRSQSAIHNYHKRFKSYVNEAFRLGLIKENPYRRFIDKRGENGERPHLTKEQVKKLMEMRDNAADNMSRKYLDFFLFQIFTGMAYSDAADFDYEEHVINLDGRNYIHSHRLKTGEEFVVPILPYTEKILKRTKNKPVINTIQKYNQFLKGVGMALGCQFPLTSHVARHTFACTIILGEGVPKEVLQVMMGHASIKTTEIYAKLPIEFIKRSVNEQLMGVWK